MSTTTEIKDSVYAGLLAKSLPRPIRTEVEHGRLTQMLLELDEREDLPPEEEAMAEVLTLLIEDHAVRQQRRTPRPGRVARPAHDRINTCQVSGSVQWTAANPARSGRKQR